MSWIPQFGGEIGGSALPPSSPTDIPVPMELPSPTSAAPADSISDEACLAGVGSRRFWEGAERLIDILISCFVGIYMARV